jgi:WD40 repeat protein
MPEPRCISDQDLRAYLLGTLPERVGRSVAAHLEGCPECDTRARRLDGATDPLLVRLRHALRPALSPDETLDSASSSAVPAGAAVSPTRLGAYRILEEVGRGGMAVVYRARQDNPERVVALKVLLTGGHGGGERRARFRAEADTIARLRHPNIVQVFEAGEQDTLPFLVLEFCEGGSLARRLGGKPQPPRAAAALVAQLARAVEHAHGAGVIHRDLKPANVLLTADGQPKVSDFGLAKAERPELTATGALLGTPSYMAPEQADGGRQVGPAADVYALGAILYELLTGRPPFQGATALETLDLVRRQEPVPPRRLQPKVPLDLETICLKCLEKEPPKRYASASALADDLGRFGEGRPVQARPVGAAGRAWRWARRNPALAVTLAGVASLLLAVAVGVSVMNWQLNAALQVSEEERLTGQHRLWEAYLAQARASRLSGRPGQRFETLEAIKKALALPVPPGHSLDEPRTEAIGCLVLADVQPDADRPAIPYPPHEYHMVPDPAYERYAMIGADGHIRIRRMADGVEVARLRDSGPPGEDLAFSPDGRLLLHCYKGTHVKLWRLDATEPAVVLKLLSGLSRAGPAFSPDSRRLALPHPDESLGIYDTATGQETRRLRPGFPAHTVALCPGRPLLAAAGGNNVLVLDTDGDRVLAELRHPARVTGIAWHPGGRLLATGCDDTKIRLWDVDRAEPVRTPLGGHLSQGIQLCFNQAGDRLVTYAWDRQLRLWETQTGRELLSLPTTFFSPFSADDRFLLGETVPNQVSLLRVATGRELRVQAVSHGSAVRGFTGVLASPDGRLLAANVGNALAFIDRAGGQEVAEVPLPLDPFGFGPDGALWTRRRRGGIQRWPVRTDPATGGLRIGPPERVHPNGYESPGLSADGRVLAIPAYKYALVLNGPDRQVELKPCEDARHAAVSPDGRWVAIGTHHTFHGPGASVWDAQTGRLVKALPVGGECRVRFSPDGRWLLTSGGGYRLWRTDSWEEGPRIAHQPGENASFPNITFARDGRLVALPAGLAQIRLTDPDTGAEVARLSVPRQEVLQPIAFAPDGAELTAIGHDSNLLYTWDLRAIRAQLKELDLDWEAPDYPPPPAQPPPLRVEVDLGK